MSQTVVIVQVVQPDFFSVGSRAAAAADGPAAILLKEGAEHPCPGRFGIKRAPSQHLILEQVLPKLFLCITNLRESGYIGYQK